jgi:hypothetical protein
LLIIPFLSFNFVFKMKIFYTILSVLLTIQMTVAPIFWSAQPTDNSHTELQKVQYQNLANTAISNAGVSYKVPVQNFLWLSFLLNHFNHSIFNTFFNFLIKKEVLLLSPHLRNAIYVYVSINAP